MRFIDFRQQLYVAAPVPRSEPMPLIARYPDPPAGSIASDQPCDLCPGSSPPPLQLTPQQTARHLALQSLLLADQHLLDPTVNLLSIPALELQPLAGC
jgi:hypothetical protein